VGDEWRRGLPPLQRQGRATANVRRAGCTADDEPRNRPRLVAGPRTWSSTSRRPRRSTSKAASADGVRRLRRRRLAAPRRLGQTSTAGTDPPACSTTRAARPGSSTRRKLTPPNGPHRTAQPTPPSNPSPSCGGWSASSPHPAALVLEPFAGSGTTVEACILEGFRCIAIEREADYLPLIVQRIHRRRDPVAAVLATAEDGGLFDLRRTGGLGRSTTPSPSTPKQWPPATRRSVFGRAPERGRCKL
jgi:hypothetical protein